MSLDLSGYMDVFADEAREHLQNLNQALLEFEQDLGNVEHVNIMFRSAHTLKGMSATMGFNEVAELTHKMENMLTPIREGKLQATEDIVDLLFKCLDALQAMADAHIAGEEHSVKIDELVSQLVELATGEAPPPKAEAPAGDAPQAPAAAEYPVEIGDGLKSEITSERNNGREVFHIHVVFEKGCELKNVRAFMVVKDLKNNGRLLHCVPPEEELAEADLGDSIDLLLSSTEDAGHLGDIALGVLEVESASVLPLGKAPAAPAPAGGGEAVKLADIFPLNEYIQTIISQAGKDGYRVVHVHVTLDEDCTLKSARAFMAHKQLEELGEIIATRPDVEDIEFEKFDLDLDFLLLTKEPAGSAAKALEQVSEIASASANDNVLLPGDEPKEEAKKPEAPASPAAKAAAEIKPAKADEKKPAARKADDKKPASQAKPTQTIRVDTSRLDHLLNLVGELVIGKTRLQQLASEIKSNELSDTIEQVDLIVFDVQNVVMQTRMVPIETVFNRFPRMIRDLAKARGKQVELVITGGETELDRTVVDEIGDPLVHLIRNALDHGIEPAEDREAKGKAPKGTLTLAAYHEGSNVFIQIKDDGAGIDPDRIRKSCVKKEVLTEDQANALSDQEAIEQIFAPGLSTAEKVTDISGRGVGMDVVKSKIEYLSGDIGVRTKLGEGSTFTIKLPLTLAIVQALLCKVSDEDYAVPLAYIEETLRIRQEDIQRVNKRDVYVLRGEVLPLVWVRDLLGSPPPEKERDNWFVVVVSAGQEQVGLCVDEPGGQMEIVIKSLGKYLQYVPYIAGGTILGDGTVALILDVAQFAHKG